MSDIQAGDVLLFRGNGFISKAIRYLDGSEVNHAAIALDATTLSEATGHGLDTSPVKAAVQRNDLTLQLRARGGDPAGAAVRAKQYEQSGVPYAYQQILLLAVLCLSRRIPVGNRLFRKVLRRLLDAAADLVNSLVDKGVDLMICSEYVYRCHSEAGYDLLPDGVPDLAAIGTVGEDGVLLLDWLTEQPLGAAPLDVGAPAPVVAEPMTVAERADYELDALLAAWFADVEGGTTVALAVDAEPVVADAEIAAAAAHLGQATARLAAQRGLPQPMGLGPADALAVLRGMVSTNANFVTPRDLLMTNRLEHLGELPK